MEYSNYYETKLYPVQNEVLKNLKDLNLPFYLTGGTALSRGYFNHRYSDDLDFFVNSDKNFLCNTEKAINTLKDVGFKINTENMTDSFVRIIVNPGINGLNDKGLKIDFVNDIDVHFGEITNTPIYYKTDSIRNILSNKYTALYRLSAKDVVDICEISKYYRFSWKDIIKEAEQKEIGIDLKEISEIFRTYTEKQFKNIKWIKVPDYKNLFSDIDNIAYDMLTLNNNSLYDKYKNLQIAKIEKQLSEDLIKTQKEDILNKSEFYSNNLKQNNPKKNTNKHKH